VSLYTTHIIKRFWHLDELVAAKALVGRKTGRESHKIAHPLALQQCVDWIAALVPLARVGTSGLTARN
jgi:hypothetical protein